MARNPKRKAKMRRDAPKSLTWRAWPAARNRRTTVAVCALLVAVWVGVGLLLQHVLWVALAVVFLGGSLLPFFAPTWYELTEDRVLVQGLLHRTAKDWSAFRGYRSDEDGVLLSPFSRPSRLDAFRGVVLRFEGNREEVMAFVERHVRPQKRKPKPDSSTP